MKNRIIAMLLCVLMLTASAVLLSGCSEEETAGTFPVLVAGVTINEKPQRITCLSSLYAEAIVDIGYASMIVGRPGDSTLPQLQSAAPCGTGENPSIDAILSAETDLLIVGTETPTDTLETLAAAGVTVLQLIEPISRTAYLNLYRCLGTAINGNGVGYADGEAAAQKVLTQLDTIERKVMLEDPVNVCIFTDGSLTSCVSGDCIGSMLIELAGGFNINIECVNSVCDMETVELSNPGIILCPSGCQSVVLSRRTLEDCDAIVYNRVYIYDTSKFSSLGDELVLATWELARLFHPDIITTEDLPSGAIDYFPTYDGVAMTSEEYEAYIAKQQEEAAAAAAAEQQNGN